MFANPRFMCNPGLGFKAPAEARVGNYIDKKCPFTGKVLTIRCPLVVVVSCVVLMAMHFEDAVCDFNSDLFVSGFHPWPYPHRCGRQAEDEQDRRHQEGLPSLCQEIQQVQLLVSSLQNSTFIHCNAPLQVREEAQEHLCPSFSLLQRHRHW